nr:glycosyltransferase [Adhaeretor mobilis]
MNYPGGSAAANRIQKIARGLARAGEKPMVLAARIAAHELETAIETEWQYDDYNIPYKHVVWPTTGSFLPYNARLILHLRPRFQNAIETLAEQTLPDAVIIYGHSGLISNPIRKFFQRREIPVVMDITEYHPTTIRRMLMTQSFDQWLCMKRLLPKLDGVIAISRWLEEFARRHKRPVLRIPALGEGLEEPLSSSAESEKFTMTYLGSMIERDLPHSLLDGVLAAASRGLELDLVIVGRLEATSAGRAARARIKGDPRLCKCVTVTGWLTDEEMRSRLRESDCFVLLRDDEIQTRACFPTRLPDYLQSAKPTILSAVGDVNLYFRHRQNAWLLKPGSGPGELADALIYLHEHPHEASEIGRAGFHTCLEELGYQQHGSRLSEFLTKLVV